MAKKKTKEDSAVAPERFPVCCAEIHKGIHVHGCKAYWEVTNVNDWTCDSCGTRYVNGVHLGDPSETAEEPPIEKDELTFPVICWAEDGCRKQSNVPRRHVEDGGIFNWKCLHCNLSYNLDYINGPATENVVRDEKKDELRFLTADELADKEEEIREDHVKKWQLDHHYGLDVVIQPLDEEPEVASVALGVFNTLIGDDPDPAWRELQMAAIDARNLAMILHGYHRLHVAPEDLPPTPWEIYIQYQKMPIKTSTYSVLEKTESDAMDAAQELCMKEHKCFGKVLAVNGIPLEDSGE